MNNNLAREIARALLAINAVVLRPNEPFTWASGMKSPIYCDNRLTLSYPEVRKMIAEGFVSLIKENYPDTEVIAGTATAGIPHAALVADKLQLPMIYIRDKAKGHGKQNQIEGQLQAGKKVIVIEDLISTGGSSLKATTAVKEAGAQATAVLAIFSYQLNDATEAFSKESIPLQTLSNYSTLLELALEEGIIDQDQLRLLESWRANPWEFGN